MNKDIYVLFEYTPSNVYASSEQKQFGCLKKENAKELTDDELAITALIAEQSHDQRNHKKSIITANRTTTVYIRCCSA